MNTNEEIERRVKDIEDLQMFINHSMDYIKSLVKKQREIKYQIDFLSNLDTETDQILNYAWEIKGKNLEPIEE